MQGDEDSQGSLDIFGATFIWLMTKYILLSCFLSVFHTLSWDNLFVVALA